MLAFLLPTLASHPDRTQTRAQWLNLVDRLAPRSSTLGSELVTLREYAANALKDAGDYLHAARMLR